MNNSININKMDNIIIATDNEGHNIIVDQRYLKYNRLISNVNAAYLLRKNTVIINNNDVSNTIIESDNCGNNTVKSFDEYVKEEMDEFSENIFKDILKKTRQKKEIQSNEIEVYLTEKRENLQEKLKKATEFNHSQNYLKAIELYENALQDITSDSYPDEFMLNDCDILAIKFALVLSKLEVRDYKRLLTAQDILNSLIGKYGFDFPSMYYYLATIYYDFGYYIKAINSLEEGLKNLDNLNVLKVINWPGTNEIIDEKLTKTVLNEKMETLMNECKVEHPPDKKCLFSQCEFNNKIYFMNLNFNGYVSVICSHKCYFSYHATCWKKKLKNDGTKAKNILNQICPTDDCGGLIEKIDTFDESLCLINCTSNEKAQSKNIKNGYNYNPIYKDHKFRNKNEETDTSTSIESIEDENEIKRDISSTHSQIKSDTEFFKPDPTETPQDSIPEATLTIKSQLNSNAKEFIPPIREPMFEVVGLCDQATQTVEKIVSQSEHNLLKCDIKILQAELFKSEENYNDLLCQHETLKLENVLSLKSTADIWTETEAVQCANCSLVEKAREKENNEKDLIIKNLLGVNQNLEMKLQQRDRELKQKDHELKQKDHEIKQRDHQINEFKTARLVDKEIYVQAEQKFLASNKVLMLKLKEEQEGKENLQQEVIRHRADISKIFEVRETVVQQIFHLKNFYMNYINMFQNKCKHMIWELEDIKTLTNVNTLPSATEIEDNLIMWRQAYDSALKNYAIMMEFYDKLAHNLNFEPSVATPIPNLIPEPPSVILRHFKSYFLQIKRLEQDLHRHISNYYQVLSMPNPGTCTQNFSQSPNRPDSRCEDLNSSNSPAQSGELEENCSNHLLLAIQQTAENAEETIKEKTVEDETIKDETMKDETTKEDTYKEETETTNMSLESTGLEEAIGGGLNRNVQESPKQKEIDVIKKKVPENPRPVTPVSPKLVVGPEGLLYKLQQKCPLTPPYILQEAIKMLREARGGLSGLDSKTLLTELKIIITDLSKKERQKSGYQKISVIEKPNPWAPINKDVPWHNSNPRGNCAICFERMTKSDSTQLKCQHVFHTACLKQWLPNNGICPICRSFTTLDDEFPPLK